jgi:hypothetical protein
MQTEPQIRLKFTVPPPTISEDPIDVYASTEAVRTLAALEDLFDYSSADLFSHLGDWGEVDHPAGKLYYELKPKRKILPSTSSQWMSGKRKMPAVRVAQAYILLELKGLELEREALRAGLPKNGPVRRSLKRAASLRVVFDKDPDIRIWLNPLRKAMAAWLKSAAHLSEYHADRYEWYRDLFKDAPWWDEADEV